MKQVIFFFLTTILIFGSVSAQKKTGANPAEPCCGIISVDAGTNLVTARNNSTGQLYQFNADALDARSLKTGDAVAINSQTNKVSSVNGAVRSYSVSGADPLSPCCTAAPCCGITSIQPDPMAPCCGIVSFQNKTSGENFSFSVPKALSGNFKVGQSVSVSNGNAILQSSVGALKTNTKAIYSYPIKDNAVANASTDNSSSDKVWEIKPNSNLKGATGRILVNLPADLKALTSFYVSADNKYLTSWEKSIPVSFTPGTYDVQISGARVKNVPVQKGMDTKINAGILNIVSNIAWQVYDETEQTYIHGDNKPEKVGLPIGNYHLKVNGQFQPIVIKNGETVEY